APFSDALFRRSVAGERAGSFRFEVKIRLPAHVYPHAKDGAAGERAWRLVILADVVPTITADAETVPRQRELAHLRPHRALPHDLVVYVQFGRPDRLAVLPGRLADELDAQDVLAGRDLARHELLLGLDTEEVVDVVELPIFQE